MTVKKVWDRRATPNTRVTLYDAGRASFLSTTTRMAFCMSALSVAMPTVGVRVGGASRAPRAQAVTLPGSLSSAVSLTSSEGEFSEKKKRSGVGFLF